jgi:hypothetical protein
MSANKELGDLSLTSLHAHKAPTFHLPHSPRLYMAKKAGHSLHPFSLRHDRHGDRQARHGDFSPVTARTYHHPRRDKSYLFAFESHNTTPRHAAICAHSQVLLPQQQFYHSLSVHKSQKRSNTSLAADNTLLRAHHPPQLEHSLFLEP